MGDKKTTSTNQGIGDEGYKGSDLSEIEKIDRRETSVKGAENLTNQDLAVIIAKYKKEASDVANVLNTFDSNLIQVFCASIEQLMHIEGIGFNPCEQDVLLTREPCMCGLMGIVVLDHIISIRDHVRFKERINVIRRWKWT